MGGGGPKGVRSGCDHARAKVPTISPMNAYATKIPPTIHQFMVFSTPLRSFKVL